MVSTVTTHRTPEGFTGAPAQPSKLITIVKLGANSAPGVTIPTSSTSDIGVKSNLINATKSEAIAPSEITANIPSKSDSSANHRST